MSTQPNPLPSLADAVTALESAVSAKNNADNVVASDQNAITAEQAKLTNLQQTLANDQATDLQAGYDAYNAAGTLAAVVLALQATFPVPPPSAPPAGN